MKGFGFTQKKLNGLTEKRRNKALANWLRECWLEWNRPDSAPSARELDDLRSELVKAHELLGIELDELASLERPEALRERLADLYQEALRRQEKKLHEEDFLPRVIQGDQPGQGPWSPVHDYWVALDQVRSGFNVGSILRSVDCLGFAGVVSHGISPAPGTKEIRKSAMGTETWIPYEVVSDMKEYLSWKKAEGYELIALETVRGAESAFTFDWPERAVILLGNEEYGLSQELLGLADHFVELPTFGRKNSLNVAQAFSAMGYLALGHWVREEGC